MARYTGPKNKLARREGIDLGLKTVGSNAHASLLRRLNIIPGVHGQKRRRRMSDFGLQLREKQKVKRIYGVLEKQFRKYYKQAIKWKGNTGEKLLEYLECRLDNTVYRMALAPTRTMARQLVTHGHVLVDGKKVNIPSYAIKNGQVITLKQKSYDIPAVKKLIDNTSIKTPEWIERKGPIGKVTRLPMRSDIGEDIDEKLIVEHYSR
ncbi:30S ribosomal protein S4 [Patescibacteria group bacterium]